VPVRQRATVSGWWATIDLGLSWHHLVVTSSPAPVSGYILLAVLMWCWPCFVLLTPDHPLARMTGSRSPGAGRVLVLADPRAHPDLRLAG